MGRIGIMAYGSLIEDPGPAIERLIRERIASVKTPFRIEFARQSAKRSNAPTVIPVDEGGNQVLATILVLDVSVTLEAGEDLLWRRESGNKDPECHYVRRSNPGPNTVVIEHLHDFAGLSRVLYTKIGANIPDLSPRNLAALALRSAAGEAGARGEDGISYLMSLKRQGISTPLMPDYEQEILRASQSVNLEEALSKMVA